MSAKLAITSGSRRQAAIAALALAAIMVHLVLRFGVSERLAVYAPWPLWAALALGGVPLVWELLQKLLQRQFGSDLLAGISIVASVALGEYLAGTLVVLMLSGGEALENYAVRSASSVLEALARVGRDGTSHLVVHESAIALAESGDQAGMAQEAARALGFAGAQLGIYPAHIVGIAVDAHDRAGTPDQPVEHGPHHRACMHV